jgi:predicted dienelactone hydrolase
MWYPCSEPSGEIDFGDIIVPGVKDCPLSGDKLPLVVISQGNFGSIVDHHDTAETLADADFIVAAINHRGDNSRNSASGDPSVMVERPTDIKCLIDFMLGASPAASKIDPERIGFFGFSAGGFTGLVPIGANPDWASVLCRFASATHVCEQIIRKDLRVQPFAHDVRIRAAVIADPPGIFFTADSFTAVEAPVQLWASEGGGHDLLFINVTPEGVAAVDRNLPAKHE